MTAGNSYVRSTRPVAPEQITVTGLFEHAVARAQLHRLSIRWSELDAALPEWTYAELLDKARRTGPFWA